MLTGDALDKAFEENEEGVDTTTLDALDKKQEAKSKKKVNER